MKTPRKNLEQAICALAQIFLTVSIIACCETAALCQPVRETQTVLTAISSRPTAGGGSMISIAAASSLEDVQSWQDGAQFHVVILNSRSAVEGKLPKGVQMRQFGGNLELIFFLKPGSQVTLDKSAKRLEFLVDGGLDATAVANQNNGDKSNRALSSGVDLVGNNVQSIKSDGSSIEGNVSQAVSGAEAMGKANLTGLTAPGQEAEKAPQSVASREDRSETEVDSSSASDGNSISSSPAAKLVPAPSSSVPSVVPQDPSGFGIPVWLAIPLCAVLLRLSWFLRKRKQMARGRLKRAGQNNNALEINGGNTGSKRSGSVITKQNEATAMVVSSPPEVPRSNMAQWHSKAVQCVIFGANQVATECSKMIRGLPHKFEVLASRANNDRRNFEILLMKALQEPDVTEQEMRRVRTALEEYGFVARQCATLLLADDPSERLAASKALGSVKSSASLPFLLEALYDPQASVRHETVASLGALGLPSAIGALLDTARKHPEIPSSLVTQALNACSVEALAIPYTSVDPLSDLVPVLGSISHERSQMFDDSQVEQLPLWIEDEGLVQALDQVTSKDNDTRLSGARNLSRFQVQRSVEALADLCTKDTEDAIRSAAVTSLGTINHESVFAPVLLALADESAGVRAAAARAMARLTIDRADAYARLVETSDDQMLEAVARACVKSSLVRMALERLASEDRRQVYEAFSLLSLVARGGASGVILDAIREHARIDVRLAAVRLIGLMGRHDLMEELRGMLETAIPEELRSSIVEALHRAEQTYPKDDLAYEYSEPVETNASALLN